MNCDKVQACRAVVDAVQAATEVLRSSDSLSQVPCPALLRNSGAALARFVSHTDVLHKQSYIRFDEPALMVAAIAILLAPLIWNTVARIEYYTRIFSRILGKHVAAYLLALWIFCFSLYRDLLFYVAIVGQPQLNVLQQPAFAALGWTCSAVGLVLVLSSMARLGVAGTYLGDYFGILQTCKVSAFPYNILDDPMYDGATLAFLGKAITESSPAGVLLSVWVFVVYKLAVMFEGPFTSRIYAEDAAKRKLADKVK